MKALSEIAASRVVALSFNNDEGSVVRTSPTDGFTILTVVGSAAEFPAVIRPLAAERWNWLPSSRRGRVDG